VDSYFYDGYGLAWNPTNPAMVFAGGLYDETVGSLSICRSSNTGLTWSTRHNFGDAGGYYSGCRALWICPTNGAIVFAGGGVGNAGRIYFSDRGGATWIERTGNLATLHSGYYAWAVRAVCGLPGGSLLAGTDAGVFRSDDGGLTWTRTPLAHATRALLCDWAAGRVYAGTADQGMFGSGDRGATWQDLNDGLGFLKCLVLALDPVNGYLFVGTDGGGIWRTTLERTCSLEVRSPRGDPQPPCGSHCHPFGTPLTNRVISPVTDGDTQYVCTGWTMTGNAPFDGAATSFAMTHTNAAVLTWIWETNYYLRLLTEGEGSLDRTSGWHRVGASPTVKATASNYWHFAGWQGDTNGCFMNSNRIMVSLLGPRTITSRFEENRGARGTPQRWLAAHGLTNGSLDAIEVADADRDGAAAWQEYAADTDPTNRASVLALTGIRTSGGDVRLEWQGGSNAWQYLHACGDLGADGAPWVPIFTSPPPTSVSGSHLAARGTNRCAAFRIAVERR
jgi:hypothetical protein